MQSLKLQFKQFFLVGLLLIIAVGVLVLRDNSAEQVEAQTYTVKAEHPRIFLTPERIARLKDAYAVGEANVSALIRNCDALLDDTPSDINTVMRAPDLALCYQITGDTKYSNKSIAFIKDYIQWLYENFDFEASWSDFPRSPDKVFDETDYGNFNMTYVSMAFDWVYDQLSDADKQFFISIFNECIDSAMIRQGIGYGDPVYNHGHTKNRTELFLGLASYGDNPRAEELINTAYNFFTNEMMPIFNRYNPGGQMYGGTNYGHRRTLHFALYNLEALRTALSIDLYAQNTWLEDFIYYMIYAQHPQGGTTYTHGTRALGVQIALGDYRDLINMEFLRSAYADKLSGAYLEDFMNKEGYNNRVGNLYQCLLRDRNIIPANYHELPLAYLCGTHTPGPMSGLGLFLARSDWDENALWMSLQGGDYVGDHQYFDMSHFTVFHGKRLVSNAGINRVLIGRYGVRQNLWYLDYNGFSPTGSSVEAFENTDDYAYVKVDLTRTYYGSEFHGQVIRSKVLNQEVSKTTRQAVLLHPDYILLYDRTGTINANIPTTWYVTLDTTALNIGGNTYSFLREGNALFIKTLLPSPINTTSGLIGGAFTELKVVPQVPTANERYLHLLYAPQISGSPMVASQKIEALTGNMFGVLIEAPSDTKVAMFSKEETSQGLAENITYQVSGAGNSKHLIVDLKPNTQFTVINTNLDTGQVVQTQTKNSSSQGTLYFETLLGSNHQITINPGASVPQTPNITLTKTANKTQAQAGEEITYTIAYRNQGQGTAQNVAITDNIPDGTTYVAGSATASGVFNPSVGVAGSLIWNIASLPAGDSGSVSFRVRVE